MQFQDAFVREQRQARARGRQSAPVEAGLGVQHLTLVETLASGAGAHRVGGLQHLQRFVAGQQVAAGQRLGFELAWQLVGPDFHGRCYSSGKLRP